MQYWILAVASMERETFGVYGGEPNPPAPSGIIDVQTGYPMEIYGYVMAENHDDAFDMAERVLVEMGILSVDAEQTGDYDPAQSPGN